jgi:hypothetical protein
LELPLNSSSPQILVHSPIVALELENVKDLLPVLNLILVLQFSKYKLKIKHLIEIEFEISYILYVNCRDQVLMTSSLS